jgi:RNA polymerase sigma-70 factor (ECF subfamily)
LRKHSGKRRTADINSVAEPADETPSVEATLIGRDRANALQEALGTLPDRQRQAVSLRFLQELSNPEVAEVMDISVDAVESLLSRGKRGLAAALADHKLELGLEF